MTRRLVQSGLSLVTVLVAYGIYALIAREELELMERHAWLVNVARGAHVVTDDLVVALRDGMIGGAGLDVTDPPQCVLAPAVDDPLRLHRLQAAQTGGLDQPGIDPGSPQLVEGPQTGDTTPEDERVDARLVHSQRPPGV